MKFDRVWAMSNKWTFSIPPIKRLLEQELHGIKKDNIIDPYAGQNGSKYAAYTNDLAVNGGIDALDYLKQWPNERFDAILLDPPLFIASSIRTL